MKILISAFAASACVFSVLGASPSTSPERVKTPLRVDLPRIGTIAPRTAAEVALDGERLPMPWVIKEFRSDGKPHELLDGVSKVVYSVSASGNDTWYVWNPGVERTPLCETLEPGEWKRFWCLEPFMRAAIPLAPGETREHVVRIRVEKSK